MFSGNFRVLIFIDLLATALGGSLILMMVLSVSKKQSSPPAGIARNYIFYQVYTEDPDAFLKVVIKNGDDNKWKESPVQELADSTSGTFMMNEKNENVFVWGPVTEYNPSNGEFKRNVFNVYSTAEKKGDWVLGVLYYNNKRLNTGSTDVISSPIKVYHHYRTLNTEDSLNTTVTLGNYSYISFNIEMEEK